MTLWQTICCAARPGRIGGPSCRSAWRRAGTVISGAGCRTTCCLLAVRRFDGNAGRGNHFAELQTVEDAHDARAFADTGLNKASLVLLVHSGSRGYGESIFRAHVAEHGTDGMDPESPAGETYLAQHELALRWARASRELIARRFDALGADGQSSGTAATTASRPPPVAADVRRRNRETGSAD
jgi:hypothetical protein